MMRQETGPRLIYIAQLRHRPCEPWVCTPGSHGLQVLGSQESPVFASREAGPDILAHQTAASSQPSHLHTLRKQGVRTPSQSTDVHNTRLLTAGECQTDSRRAL